MKEKSFTMIELLLVILIFSILVSLSFVVYAKTVEQAREKTCIQNQLLIKTLLDNYITENNSIPPGGLAEIPEEYFIKALAKLEKSDPLFSAKRNLYAKIIHPFNVSNAYAQSPDTLLHYTGVKKEFLICPMDKRDGINYSYAYNVSLSSLMIDTTVYDSTKTVWELLLNSPEVILVDSETDKTLSSSTGNYTSGVAPRHTHLFAGATAMGVRGTGKAASYNSSGSVVTGGGSTTTTTTTTTSSVKTTPGKSETAKSESTTFVEEALKVAAEIFNGTMSVLEKGAEAVIGLGEKLLGGLF